MLGVRRRHWTRGLVDGGRDRLGLGGLQSLIILGTARKGSVAEWFLYNDRKTSATRVVFDVIYRDCHCSDTPDTGPHRVPAFSPGEPVGLYCTGTINSSMSENPLKGKL